MEKYKKLGISLILPAILLFAWFYSTTYKGVPAVILPSIKAVGNAFMTTIESGQLLEDLRVSFIRVVRGYVCAVSLGFIIGVLTGMNENIKAFLNLTLTTIRQIPMVAWVPLIILWFGIDDMSKVVTIVLAAFFPVMINTSSGIATTPESYLELARIYRMSPWKTFIRVYLPNALPSVFVGLRLALGSSWMAVVAAEILGATSGMGYRLSFSRTLMQPDIMFTCMIVIGVVGIIMDKLLLYLFEVLTPWSDTKKGK